MQAKEEDGDADRSTEASQDRKEEQEERGDEEAEEQEPWHEWIQRLTGRALEETQIAGVED